MPTIGDHPTVSKGKSKSKLERAGINATPNNKHPPWLLRTKIKLTGTRTPSINLKDQSDEIKAVLHESFNIGKIKMLTDTQYSPVADGGLDRIAIDALIDAAVKLKYNKEGDIAARLRHGKYDYVHPLREYVRFHSSLIFEGLYPSVISSVHATPLKGAKRDQEGGINCCPRQV